jgi:hypothetical protein
MLVGGFLEWLLSEYVNRGSTQVSQNLTSVSIALDRLGIQAKVVP